MVKRHLPLKSTEGEQMTEDLTLQKKVLMQILMSRPRLPRHWCQREVPAASSRRVELLSSSHPDRLLFPSTH